MTTGDRQAAATKAADLVAQIRELARSLPDGGPWSFVRGKLFNASDSVESAATQIGKVAGR